MDEENIAITIYLVGKLSIAYKKFRVYTLYTSNIVVANKYNKGNNGDDNNHNYNKYGVSVILNLPLCPNKSRFAYLGNFGFLKFKQKK